MTGAQQKACYHQLIYYSDALYQKAVQFMETQHCPTNSQANGLLSVINAESSISTVLTKYIQNQATKSTTKDPAFWNGLKRELESLKGIAEEFQQKIGNLPDDKKIRNEIHLLLARDYVQHLVSHILYQATLNGGN